MLDCGEGSLGQLSRRFGREALEERLLGLKCVWISHMHADHHLGLLRVLSHRAQAARRAGREGERLTVVGPPPLSKWLRTYASFDQAQYDLVHNARLFPSNEWVGAGCREVLKGLLAEGLGVDVVTVPVKHSCRDACAVIVSDRCAEGETPWKIAYSGDTRPCQSLIDAGRGATLLIHEATLDTPLEEDAKAKQHSTTGEALGVGGRMGAYRTLLTHFSQRYPKVPPLEEVTAHGAAAVAFDFMSVDLADLPSLPSMMAPLARLADEQGWHGLYGEAAE
uniref:ribonuclease Z n=1 Tax=Hemiselmis andersenii TaxID=464988 RepID=A0A6U2E235_HEMAN|mmetsp:Transcript_25197/g.61113  ORF Transcript_25197/g.61113 Transcript_25197/m.61113 type:complete len:279 (+) Transcript_25197:1-837(+)